MFSGFCGVCWGIALILVIGFFFAYASFHVSSGVYLRAFCRKKTKEKQIALTFDDGPHHEYTSQVLDVLNKYNVKATFFLIGERISGNENILNRMQAGGHQIGNHSFSHTSMFPFLGVMKMADNLLQCEQAVSRITGHRMKWFRPPFGVTNPNVAKAVKIRGYQVAGWSIRSLDTVISNREKVVNRIVARLHPGAIILLHDHLPDAPYILEQTILKATEKGYSFVTIEQLF